MSERLRYAASALLQGFRTRLSQQRLGRHFALFAIVTLVASLYLSYLVVVYKEGRLAAQMAERRASLMLSWAEAGLPPPSGFGWLAGSGDRPFDLPEALRDLPPGHHLIGGDDQLEHLVVRDDGQNRVYALYGDALHGERIAAIGRAYLALGLALLMVVFVLANGWAAMLLSARPVLRKRLARNEALDAEEGEHPPRGEQGPSRYSAYESDLRDVAQREREFIANVGHELRTPVTLVMTTTELLAESPRLSDADRRQLRRIMDAAEHMSETIRSFMVLARDEMLGNAEPVELRSVVWEVVRLHEDEARQKHLDLQMRVSPGVTVDANREALFVLINNLVRNAVKYTDRGGVAVRQLGRALYVVDTGPGIAVEDREQLFLPFYRARRVAESGQAGLGLGLAIVKRIADYYEWELTVQSTPGLGATFSIRFPPARSLPQ